MHGYRKISSSSSSSDEDLHSLLVNKDRKDLYACEVISCEFCDEAFLNRYNYLVHNAKHIIIPLLRKTYFMCQECNLQCTTNGKFQKHMKKVHPYVTISHHNNNTNYSIASTDLQIVGNNTYDDTDYDNENDVKTSKNENGKEILSTLEREIKLSTPETILPVCLPVNKELNHFIEIIEIESDDNDEFEVKEELNHNSNTETMRNRLVFEDDEEDIIKSNGLISDLMADIKVSVPFEPWMSSIADEKKNDGTMVEPESIKTQLEEKWRSKTVSYQELIKMENVSCKYCKETFLNRLSLIKHQSCHIASKRRYPFLCVYCDWYVACDPSTLHKHHISRHPDRETKSMNNVLRKTCPSCKLKYISKQKHCRNYHNTELEYRNHDQEENKDISKPTFMKKTIKICDLCSSFLKNKSNFIYYKNVGERSISGECQTCAHCLKQYFSINLFEITTRHKFFGPKKPKPVSNMDRLKNFQNRLKLMKK